MNDAPSYTWEMFKHDTNLIVLGASCALSMLGSALYGPVGSLPVLIYSTGFALASLFVASTPGWKAYVDRRLNQQQREDYKNRMLEQISTACQRDSYMKECMNRYHRMTNRFQLIQQLANDPRSKMSSVEVLKFDDMLMQYLALALAWYHASQSKRDAVSGSELKAKVEQLDRMLETNAGVSERLQWERARKEYLGMMDRHRSRQSRLLMLEASLLSVPDKMEELYQMLAASPYNEDIASRVEETLNNLSKEQDIEALLQDELSSDVIAKELLSNTKKTVPPQRTKSAQPIKQ
jgi:hypothetical protein